MIKFFRTIRYSLMEQNKTGKYIKYAIGEIVLVVIGILIALQINNWNQEQKENKQERFILQKLQNDIRSDVDQINNQLIVNGDNLSDFKTAVNILLNNETGDFNTFKAKFSNILNISGFNQNETTFNNLISTGKIELIKNQVLLDSILSYYNKNYESWDTAMKDYTRNIIAPQLLNYDHLPQTDYKRDERFSNEDFSNFDKSKSDVAFKSLDDYRKNVFVINILLQKIWILEGQINHFSELRNTMDSLLLQIKKELDD